MPQHYAVLHNYHQKFQCTPWSITMLIKISLITIHILYENNNKLHGLKNLLEAKLFCDHIIYLLLWRTGLGIQAPLAKIPFGGPFSWRQCRTWASLWRSCLGQWLIICQALSKPGARKANHLQNRNSIFNGIRCQLYPSSLKCYIMTFFNSTKLQNWWVEV